MKTSLLRWLSAATLFALPAILRAAETAPVTVKRSLFQELNMPAIWFLVVCSMIVVYFVLDVYMKSAPRLLIPTASVEALRDFFRKGDYQGAFNYCAANPDTVTNVVHAGLKHAPGGQTASEDAMSSAIVGENSKFQNKIAYLSVIGVIAPMVGLTGTVLGMIDAFSQMGQAGAGDPSKLSGAIGHVLHATAGGLIVAIPAFVFYYLLRNRVSHQIHGLSITIADLFRKFPYAHLTEIEFAGGESYAAAPTWNAEAAPATEPQA